MSDELPNVEIKPHVSTSEQIRHRVRSTPSGPSRAFTVEEAIESIGLGWFQAKIFVVGKMITVSSIYPTTHLFTHPSNHQHIHLITHKSIQPPTNPWTHQSIKPSTHPPSNPPIHKSMELPIRASIPPTTQKFIHTLIKILTIHSLGNGETIYKYIVYTHIQ